MSILEDKRVLQLANIGAAIITIVINLLANALPINNKTTQELSDNLPNLFVPAGLTFSIWGVIYLLWIVFIIYQGRDLFSKEKIEMPFLNRISVLFVVASAANCIWIFLWHYEQVILSLGVIIVLFLSLLAIYLRLDIGRTEVSRDEKLFVHVPFSVYLGWLTVATIANTTGALVSINWDGFGIPETLWTVLVIVVAVVITLAMLFTRKDVAYSLVVVWASLGIVLKQATNDTIVATTALLASIVVLLGIIITLAPKFIKWYQERSS